MYALLDENVLRFQTKNEYTVCFKSFKIQFHSCLYRVAIHYFPSQATEEIIVNGKRY